MPPIKLAMQRSVLFLCVVVCASVLGCGIVTDPEVVCGQDKVYDHKLEVFYSDIIGGVREFIIEGPLEPKDICSRMGHVTPTYHAIARNPSTGIPLEIKLFGIAQIPGRTARSAELFNDGTGDYTGAVEIGLTQVYGDKAGYIIMQIHVKFPSRGDHKTDSTFLRSHIQDFRAKLNYREYIEVTE